MGLPAEAPSDMDGQNRAGDTYNSNNPSTYQAYDPNTRRQSRPGPPIPGQFPEDNAGDADASYPLPPSNRDGREQNQSQSPATRDRSKTGGSRRPSGSRICGKCGESLTGQFVRALGDTFHLECFTCHVSALLSRCQLLLTSSTGLREDCRVKVLPRA